MGSQGQLAVILRAAGGGLRVAGGRDTWHGEHAVAALRHATSVRFAYLFTRATEIVLALYPADTLGQARVFYEDEARVQRTLALEDGGWTVRPNFHFGFAKKGLTWTTSRLGLREYTDYWRRRIATLEQIERPGWERELEALVQAGVFDPSDLDQFARDFTRTKRSKASPRPGLSVSRAWPLEQAEERAFVPTLGAALKAALLAFGEQRTLVSIDESRDPN